MLQFSLHLKLPVLLLFNGVKIKSKCYLDAKVYAIKDNVVVYITESSANFKLNGSNRAIYFLFQNINP